jgi:hypothetical protein
MKKTLLVLLLLSSNIIFAQFAKNSSTSVVIPPPNYSPTGTNSTIYTTTDGFDNFFLGNDFGEPYIAVNPTDPKNQVCAFNMNSFYYTLNGVDWTRGYPVFSGFPTLGDPVMTFDSLGNIYYAQLYNFTTSGTYGIAVAKSTNKGVSWYSYVSAASTMVGLSDKEWITADQTGGPYSNYIYIGWRQFGATGMRFVRSTNGGVSYSTPITLNGDQGAYISVGANGNISGGYVYYACTSNNNIPFYRSSNGGASFQSLGNAVSGISGPGTQYNGRWTMKAAKIRTDYFPRMAADNSYNSTRGNVYVVYAANPPGADLADIFLVRSTNNGVNWSSPIRVNDDASTCDQWMPTVSVDKKTGKIFIGWYDSRNDPNNIMTEVYGTTSTNGGLTFTPNSKISNANFNPNVMAVAQSAGDAYYMGDYIGTAGTMNGVTSITSWMDGRANIQSNMMSFVGYNPDFALTTDASQKLMGNNDSAIIRVTVPGIKGIFNDRIKFSYSLDTLPVTGTITVSFVNGKDSIVTYPDSLYVKVKTVGNISPSKNYKLNILGAGINGTPVHKRVINLLVNSSIITVGSNRPGTCDFKVNGQTYNTTQQFTFPNGTIVNVQAVSPQVFGGTRYIFKNWSDNGDTIHNITVSAPFTLTVNYKPQYLLYISSLVGNTFGGNQFYDSAVTFTFGVLSRTVLQNGQIYRFKGWDGNGTGSYTSTDSSGLDSAVTISLKNAISEIPRWISNTGINTISSEIPSEYKLFQNYPNPFNPSTIIRFQIKDSKFVALKIYDILGREITTLLNEKLKAGIYEISFSINQLPSGIYFYKISTGDFSDIKKMVLMK